MSLLEKLPTSILGLKGNKPEFSITPNPPGSFHDSYSLDGNPLVQVRNNSANFILPQPSRLDEKDVSNNNKYRSNNNKYLDNPPR